MNPMTAPGDQCHQAGRKIRGRDEQQPVSHLRSSILFLAVHEQDESDAAWNEREEQPGRVESL